MPGISRQLFFPNRIQPDERFLKTSGNDRKPYTFFSDYLGAAILIQV
jgi:hypothetical protein